MWGPIAFNFVLVPALAAVCFILFSVYILYMHKKYDHIPGPPRDSFIFGHYPTILKLMRKNELMFDLFLEWVQKHGPIIRINFLHRVTVLVVSPEAVKEFLMSPKYTKGWFYSRMFNMFGVRFMGKGLLTDRDYDHWHKQRRIMDPAFNRTYLTGMMGPFNEKAEYLLEKLELKADGKTEVGMRELLCRVTLDVISKVAFGMDLNSIDDDQTPFPRAISLVMRGLVEMRNPFMKFSWKKQKYIKDTQESVRLLRTTGRECIERRRKAIEDGEDVPVDILTKILKGAGQETTANQLAFTGIELARNPDILKKAQEEVDEVLGSRRDLEYDDLGKLQYLSQVLKESLRLYSTAPGTSRVVDKETVIEGLRIPAGTTLMFNSYIMGRMEQFYPDPLVFNPDRFHPDAPKPYFSYFPFSLGPRSCIGQVFAQMEAKVIMAKLLQRFKFELVEGQSFKIYDTASLRPMGGVICRLMPRTNSRTIKK
ncbi:cholesterol 24-hydroxylase-like isoform X2 [Pyxicephalus adspersus]|uniref:cholesterol 24-hydroxylase-like isoform X2 n=1 Tax=Pyxicephalus adspersus TaxID=30357 RepID=UPI003B5B2650